MKLSLLFVSIFLVHAAKAGTPDINGSSMLYVIALTLLGGIIVIPYLSRYLQEKFKKPKSGPDEKAIEQSEELPKKKN